MLARLCDGHDQLIARPTGPERGGGISVLCVQLFVAISHCVNSGAASASVCVCVGVFGQTLESDVTQL